MNNKQIIKPKKEVRYIEPKKPTINILSKEETMQSQKKINEQINNKNIKKKISQPLDDLEKELENIKDEEADNNYYSAKRIDNDLYGLLVKNPENSHNLIFKSTVKNLNKTSSKPEIHTCTSPQITIPSIRLEKEKIINSNSVLNSIDEKKLRSSEYPNYMKSLQSVSKIISDKFLPLCSLHKLNILKLNESLEKICVDDNLELFNKYYNTRKLIDGFDIETLKHLLAIEELRLYECLRIIVDTEKYKDLKTGIDEKSSSFIKRYSGKEDEDSEKLTKKRKRSIHRTKSRSKGKFKKKQKRKNSRISSTSSSYSSSHSSIDRKQRKKEKIYKNDKIDKIDDKKFNSNCYNNYIRHENYKNYREEKYPNKPIGKSSSVYNNNDHYKKGPKSKYNQSNTFVGNVIYKFDNNNIIPNSNNISNPIISNKSNIIDKSSKIFMNNSNPIGQNSSSNNYLKPLKTEKVTTNQSNVSSKINISNNNGSSNANEKSLTGNHEKEKIILKIKETIKERTNKNIETEKIQSKENSLDISPKRQDDKLTENNRAVLNTLKPHLFDYSDFVD